MIATEPTGTPSIYEVLSAARYLVEVDKRYGRSTAGMTMAIRRLTVALELLDNDRQDPPARVPVRWDVPRIIGLLGVFTGSLVLWALAGAGLAYLVGLVGSWL